MAPANVLPHIVKQIGDIDWHLYFEHVNKKGGSEKADEQPKNVAEAEENITKLIKYAIKLHFSLILLMLHA